MTTDPTPLVPDPMEFTSPDRERERTLFRIDGEDFYALKPKGGQMLRLGIEAAAIQQRTGGTGDVDLSDALIIDGFMDTCFEPETTDRLRERLEDPDDNFDIDTLMEVMQALERAWGRRPTGRSGGSSQRRPRSGRTSTARARSKA